MWNGNIRDIEASHSPWASEPEEGNGQGSGGVGPKFREQGLITSNLQSSVECHGSSFRGGKVTDIETAHADRKAKSSYHAICHSSKHRVSTKVFKIHPYKLSPQGISIVPCF